MTFSSQGLYMNLNYNNNGEPHFEVIPHEQKPVYSGMIKLDQIPYENARVIVNNDGMVEIDINQPITNPNQYKVDYKTANAGIIYFHSDREGQMMDMTYTGKGIVLIDGSRVVTLYENGSIKEVLNDFVNSLRVGVQANLDIQSEIQANEKERQNDEALRQVNETIRQNLYIQVQTETLMIYKDAVSTYNDITTTYPSPQIGWVAQTSDTKARYRYNGTSWVNIGVYLDSGDIVVSSNQPTQVVNMWIKKIG